MNKKRLLSVLHLTVLTIILASILVLFWQARDDRTMQVYTGMLLSVVYVAWGMVYHAMQGDLYPTVVIEYLLVGAIAVTLIITVVWI